MRENRFKYFAYVMITAVVIAGTIMSNVLANSECSRETSICVLIITIVLDILSMVYFIVQDITSNKRTIARYGSLSLFETLDRKSISRNVINKLRENPADHVVYIECNGLPGIELENIKQRIYDDLTDYKKIYGKDGEKYKHFSIANVFIPVSLDLQEFNESVFYNRTKSNKFNIYIFDSYSANSFFIAKIRERLNKKHAEAAYNIAKNTYIIYLCDRDIPVAEDAKIDTSLTTSIQPEDLKNLLTGIAGADEQELVNFNLPACSVNHNEGRNEIRNIFVFENLLKEPVNRQLIKINPNIVFVLYYNETGNYKTALELLCSYMQNYGADMRTHSDKNDLLYIDYLFADTLHLLNIYQIGITFCVWLLNRIERDRENSCDELKIEVIKKYAHILKHVGYFTCSDTSGTPSADIDANNVLDRISEKLDTEDIPLLKKCRSLDDKFIAQSSVVDNKIYVSKKKAINTYFSFLTAALCSCPSRLKSTIRIYDRGQFIKHISDSAQLFSRSDTPDDIMYYSAFLSYKNPSQAMRHIDEVVDYFEKTNHRRKYNAYYIKAEIMRMLGDYDGAYRFYIKSSGMTEGHADVNLLDQNYFSLRALEKLNLVNGMASFQVKSYRDSLFDGDGMRKDYDECISLIAKIFKSVEGAGKARPELRFNKTLTEFIDDADLRPDDLKKLLAENIFIIL